MRPTSQHMRVHITETKQVGGGALSKMARRAGCERMVKSENLATEHCPDDRGLGEGGVPTGGRWRWTPSASWPVAP